MASQPSRSTHSVTCYPTQVNAPRLNPSQKAGTRFTYPGLEGWVDLGYPAMHRPGVELAVFRSRVRRPTTTLPSQPSLGYAEIRRVLGDNGSWVSNVLYCLENALVSCRLCVLISGSGGFTPHHQSPGLWNWLPFPRPVCAHGSTTLLPSSCFATASSPLAFCRATEIGK